MKREIEHLKGVPSSEQRLLVGSKVLRASEHLADVLSTKIGVCEVALIRRPQQEVLLSVDEIAATPSRAEGISEEVELEQRLTACHCVRILWDIGEFQAKSAEILACYYVQLFYMAYSVHQEDLRVVAVAAACLANSNGNAPDELISMVSGCIQALAGLAWFRWRIFGPLLVIRDEETHDLRDETWTCITKLQALSGFDPDPPAILAGEVIEAVSYTHLTLPTSDLV